VPRWLASAAAGARWPLWIGYGVSGLVYVARIRDALRAARAPGYAPVFLGASGWAPEVFFLVGTASWLAVGIRRTGSPARAAASMGLAGLHILLFAVRVYLGPLIWALGAAGR
jgi:hypothetical protein